MAIEWHELADLEAAGEAAALHVVNRMAEALAAGEYATLAISGGSTPKVLFERLAAAPFSWNRVHIFWVDERMVPPNHADSNFRMAQETLLTPAQFSETQIHRIRGELDPEAATRQYTEEIRKFFHLPAGALPSFDLVHLGLGADGHTASLFPGGPLIEDRTHIAAAVYVDNLRAWRVTLLPGVLVAAREILFFTAGGDKREVTQDVVHGPYEPHRWPSQVIIRNAAHIVWFVGGT